MVKMRFLLIGSVFFHGLIAFSIGQYVSSEKLKTSNSFPIILLSSTKKNDVEMVRSGSSRKVAHYQNRKMASSKENNIVMQTSDALKVIYNPAPAYPANAKRNGEEGIFSVKIIVGMSGKVEHVELMTIKGKKEFFEEELLRTLKTWQFKPRDREISFEVPISFQLEE